MKETAVLRDAFIETLLTRMETDDSIFFVSADFGAPALDRLREQYPERFVNVGIAEQNLINVATGLALEGFKVYAYAIAPFLTMRAYEQIRTNLSILSQVRPVNVTLVGVGIGLSYDVTGPTHHCLEDLSIMRMLPNFTVCSPSDAVVTAQYVGFSLEKKGPKYIRLDGKPQPCLYADPGQVDFVAGFRELVCGEETVIVATGYMTHRALAIAALLERKGRKIGVVDLFMPKSFDRLRLLQTLCRYGEVVTLEEGFLHAGGLDGIVGGLLRENGAVIPMKPFGFKDRYVFDVGDRQHLLRVNGLDDASVAAAILGQGLGDGQD